MNELMFRIGVHAANSYDFEYLKPLLDKDVQIQQNIIGHNQSPYEVFESVWGFYVAAVIVELLSISLVAATFWGYQRLGRDVSLSPLEIAKVSPPNTVQIQALTPAV